MSPKELAELLQQHPETIRNWSGEYARHLSKHAAPDAKGKHRSYDDNDISVLALVADYKNRGLNQAVIHKALEDGERLMPGIVPNGAGGYQNQLANLQTQLEQAKRDLATQTARADDAESRSRLLSEQNSQLLEQIARLNREIGRLEAQKFSE